MIKKSNVLTKTISQYKDSLQYYAISIEYPPPDKFVVRSDSVNIVLALHESKQMVCVAKKVKYIHANLHSKILIEDEMYKLVYFDAQNP